MGAFGISDATIIIGQLGHGKSTLAEKISNLYPRVVYVDLMNDHDKEKNPDAIRVSSIYEFGAALAETLNQSRFQIVYEYQPGQGNAHDVMDALIQIAWERGSLCFTIDEAWNFVGDYNMSEWMKALCFARRHRDLALVACVHRPTQVSKNLLALAAHVFCGQQFHPDDVRYFQSVVGEAALNLPKLEKYHFLWWRPSAPSKIVTS